jgi:S1-C subfamily serine protease
MKLFQRLTIIFLTAIIGFIAGVWGALMVENLYPTELICCNGSVDESNNDQAGGVLIFRDDKKILKDVSVGTIEKSIIGIARAKKESTNILDNYYLPQDIIAYGFVLTDDGWIVTVADNLEKEISSDLVILSEGRVLSFKDKVLDPSTGVLFLKVETDGSVLNPIKIGESDRVEILDELVSVDLFGNTSKHTLVSVDSFDNLVQSSEVLGRRFVVSGESVSGVPLINSSAEVVGIADRGDEGVIKMIPISYFKNKIAQVLKDGNIERTLLGINYIDLAEFSQSGQFLDGVSQKRGAFVFSPQITDAVLSGSPAQKSGLKYKDIIISIEDEELGVNKNISEIIQEYKSGSEVNLEVLRGGNKLNLNVKLTNIK